ncbi:hypothetical protein M406DRAFT_329325 [Cryphonectria parasitica EP155]|uniref:DUF7702 domain-containing protein n=1 Tax=Cryphonectria parasitica (strain ATCC 38755 / EP155) TaxID=660469 RepID=A0A9P4Y2I1_CRYP1|nr:uncharacterized protein M406DRAFT_329325 [Cryphonectria parasitica EP155]KAF3765421.1 hypothetical protein M406DRAFT_329325 [Cryphonectria parasitica EP155]
MAVSYRTGITILQFIFFVPSLVLSLFLCFHYGLKWAATWRFIATLSALRVAGDVSYFISLSHPSINIYVAVIVCELMGLAPLMLTLVAFVNRVNKTTHSIPTKSSLTISLLSLTGLITGIVGTSRALDDATTINDVQINTLIKAALALFLAGYGLMFVGFLFVALDVARHPAKRAALGSEMRILVTVVLACPFVFVRLLYGALGDLTGEAKYSSLYGSNTIYLCMGVLMEILAVAICLASAFLVPVPEGRDGAKERGGLQDTRSAGTPTLDAQN